MTLLENLIQFDERYVQVLELSQKELFQKIIFLFNKYYRYNEEANDIIVLDNEKRLEFSKSVLVVNDYFNIQLNSNKIIKALYNDIELEYNLEYGENNFSTKLEEVLINIQDILSDYDFQFEYKTDLKLSDLLKIIGLKFDEYSYDEPFKNLICLFDFIVLFKVCKILVLINAKIFFSEEEIIQIYRAALQRNIKLLLIEYSQGSTLMKYEKKLFVDNEFDEFIIE